MNFCSCPRCGFVFDIEELLELGYAINCPKCLNLKDYVDKEEE